MKLFLKSITPPHQPPTSEPGPDRGGGGPSLATRGAKDVSRCFKCVWFGLGLASAQGSVWTFLQDSWSFEGTQFSLTDIARVPIL